MSGAAPSERLRGALHTFLTALVALLLPIGAGFGFARLFAPTVHSKYFPWITGRALGLAGYLSLCALVIFGIWIRHPWRFRWSLVHGETRLRLHASLGTATLALVIGHLVSLASDRYAGVGWVGAFVPGFSQYRTLAVSLGVVSFFFMILLFTTARAAGRRGARHWRTYHRMAIVTFVMVWLHGVLAGTDTRALGGLYVVSALAIATLAATRYGASRHAGLTPDARDDGSSGSSRGSVAPRVRVPR